MAKSYVKKLTLCHDKEYIYNLLEEQGYASFGPCGFIPSAASRKSVEVEADSGVSTLNAQDFGPQRFCCTCGAKLLDVYDEGDSAFFKHPETVCPKAGMLLDVDEMTSGWNHKDLDMDDLKKVYKGLKGKDAQWLKDNKNILSDIYKENADYACQEKESLPLLETSTEKYQDAYDTGTRISGLTELTKEELWLMGRIGGSRCVWKEVRTDAEGNVSEKVHGRSFLLYSPRKALDLIMQTSNIRVEISDDLGFIACYFILVGDDLTPQRRRFLKKYPRNWIEMSRVIKMEERRLEYVAKEGEEALTDFCGY